MHPTKPRLQVLFTLSAILFSGFPAPAVAADVSPVVMVVCDNQQGSGSIISLADGGYVATAGHVVLDDAGNLPERCYIGLTDTVNGKPQTYYEATVVHAVFNRRLDRDFGLLHVGRLLGGQQRPLPGHVSTFEFAQVGSPITINGYPGTTQRLTSSPGMILSYGRGTVRTDAKIEPGYSGGPVLDASNRLVGIATRVAFEIDDVTGQERVLDYEASDILSFLVWLDEFPSGHDTYIVHHDAAEFHSKPFVLRNEEIGCANVVRTTDRSTLYCLVAGNLRFVFPNEATYFSWFDDYATVRFASAETLAGYDLIGNVTMRAGSLVKITTDPKVYLVNDGIGTLRPIPDERTAMAYFGADWAKKVKDVPDTFFIDYRVDGALPEAP